MYFIFFFKRCLYTCSIGDVAAEMQHKRNVHVGLDRNRVGHIEAHKDWSSNLDPKIFAGGEAQLRELYGMASIAAWMGKRNTRFVGFDKWDKRFLVLQGVTLRCYKSEEDALSHGKTLEAIRSLEKEMPGMDEVSALGATLRRQNKAGARKKTGGVTRDRAAPAGSESIYLKGYEIFLDPNDSNFIFRIHPINTKAQKGSKEITLRAESAEERDVWVHALLASTMVASANFE